MKQKQVKNQLQVSEVIKPSITSMLTFFLTCGSIWSPIVLTTRRVMKINTAADKNVDVVLTRREGMFLAIKKRCPLK